MNPRHGKERSSFLIFISNYTMRAVPSQTQYVVSVSFSFWDFVILLTPCHIPHFHENPPYRALGENYRRMRDYGDSVNIYKPLDFFDFDFNLAQMRFKGWFCLWGTLIAKRR